MKFYKIVNGKNFVGVATTNDLRTVQKKYAMLISCLESEAQYVQVGNDLYHANWMRNIKGNEDIMAELVDVIEISQEEYDKISSTIEKGEVYEKPIDEINADDGNNENIGIEDIDDSTQITVAYMKEMKIKEMSGLCEKIITNGFDIKLSDNKSHHFSLSIQDQLNLLSMAKMIENGETLIPYHADGELCKAYSVEDMSNIITYATEFKTFHTTYFNSLKAYINSLRSVNTVSAIEYGVEIPEKYQSDILKQLYAKMS